MKVRSLSKAILTEMALRLGDAPGFDPERQREISQGRHAYAGNPAFPEQAGEDSFAEDVSSAQYREIVRKISQSSGIPVAQISQRSLPRLMGQMMGDLQRAQEYEHGHEEELVAKAIEVLFSLPEFAPAKAPYEAGVFRIEAQLVRNPGEMTMQGMNVDPEEETPEERQALGADVDQIARELDSEKNKRKFINLLIQGSSMNKNYAYHMAADALNAISPELVRTYSRLMPVAEWAYWAVPENSLRAAMSAGQGHGGKEWVSWEGKVATVHAQALVFPVLLQELAKGLMEFLSRSHLDELDPETRKHVKKHANTLGGETSDIRMGPEVWRRFLNGIGQQNQEYVSYIYRHLTQLPPGEFSQRMSQILRADPEGRRFVDQLVQQIRDAQDQQQESVTDSVSRLLN
jgi:hypothetical protein